MKLQKYKTLIEKAAWVCPITLVLIACHVSSASAEQTPPKGCVAVSKQEYDSAKKQNLLVNRFSRYERTGRIGRRYYWYCRS